LASSAREIGWMRTTKRNTDAVEAMAFMGVS
jgi:hypothetical protein